MSNAKKKAARRAHRTAPPKTRKQSPLAALAKSKPVSLAKRVEILANTVDLLNALNKALGMRLDDIERMLTNASHSLNRRPSRGDF